MVYLRWKFRESECQLFKSLVTNSSTGNPVLAPGVLEYTKGLVQIWDTASIFVHIMREMETKKSSESQQLYSHRRSNWWENPAWRKLHRTNSNMIGLHTRWFQCLVQIWLQSPLAEKWIIVRIETHSQAARCPMQVLAMKSYPYIIAMPL